MTDILGRPVKLGPFYKDGSRPRHSRANCDGPCPWHSPSDHPMRDWPREIKRSGLVERVCEHGVGHPDPDSMAFMRRYFGENVQAIHGCCGCCPRT